MYIYGIWYECVDGLFWPMIEANGGLLWTQEWTVQELSWYFEPLVASHLEICIMEFVRQGVIGEVTLTASVSLK
jgi:hypothetical protein